MAVEKVVYTGNDVKEIFQYFKEHLGFRIPKYVWEHITCLEFYEKESEDNFLVSATWKRTQLPSACSDKEL